MVVMTGSSSLQDFPLTRTQRWTNALTVVVALFGLGIGFLMKDQIISATVPFRDLAAGILARYPQGWLLDTAGDYVFRVRDPESPRFLTTLQVQVIAIGQDAAARNILDDLTLQRAQTLAAYRILRAIPDTLPDGDPTTRVEYVYVATETNPFLEPVPVVVYGVDMVTLKRGQAVIVTFRVEAERFEDEAWRLEQFLASLEF